MHRFGAADLIGFLLEVDASLQVVATIVVIGGSAVALGYDSDVATADIDLWGNPGPAFWEALALVAARRPVIPTSVVGIASPPLDFEDRLVKIPLEASRRLTVLVPEAHDLALLKVGRAEEHDLVAVAAIHASFRLSLTTLIARYQETLSQVIGPPSRFRLNFLALVERLFGEETASRVESELA